MYWLKYSKVMTYKDLLKLNGLRIDEELNSLFLILPADAIIKGQTFTLTNYIESDAL